jgi:AAA+ ATPase superfamily predicted ATPase
MNPYNCTSPGTCFTGYKLCRKKLLDGFRNGNSFAILGGRRCGKTSLLIQIEKDILKEGLAPFYPLVKYFDFEERGSILNTALLFEKIYNLIVQDINTTASWINDMHGKEYENFLKHLNDALPLFNEKYGPDWVVILLVDEMDTAFKHLPDDQFFQNLRNFLTISRFKRYFRLVATGLRKWKV